jgi:hypothetical protein
LDGSGVSSDELKQANLRDLVVLADGLDDCGDQHHQVAAGLARFAQGHPDTRVVVTTRPIGYETTELAGWRHYALLAPEENDGKVNLGALIQVATDKPEVTAAAHEIATRELSGTAAAKTIAASPQMLGMAASIIIQQGKLPQSRPRLYDQMISLLAASPRALGSAQGQGSAISARVLDILGWTLAQDPLAQTNSVTQACATRLAPELGVAPLLATTHVDASLLYWEEVGLIERLHHGGTTLLTFIHTTFGEFSAARFLTSLPASERRQQLERIFDDPA